jgi:hypothetical protein
MWGRFRSSGAVGSAPSFLLLVLFSTLLQSCGQAPSGGNNVLPSPSPLSIATTGLPDGQVGAFYTATLVATGGTTPYRWALTSGTLPVGLALNASNGAITGTPTAAVNGTSLTFQATDSGTSAQNKSVSLTLTIAPTGLAITTASLPSGQVGTAYSATLAASGGTAPYSWAVTSGVLPAGLTLNASTGAITGTPTAAVNATLLTFQVTDSGTRAQNKSVNFTLTIVATGITVSVSPKRAALAITQALSLVATTNDPSGVNWSASGTGCSGSTCGTFCISPSCSVTTYTAPSVAGVYTITATSVSNTAISASLLVAVTDLSGVLTYHNNLSRDGTNTHEFALTSSIVTTATFGKLFSCTTDGAIYAQPLWIPQISIASVKHNVVVVATQHESLYAFDADTAPCTTLWHANLIDSTHGGTSGETSVPSGVGGLVGSGLGDITPEVGVTGTPVIDPTTQTLYVVSKSVIPSGPTFFQRLHAIDLTTGNEKFSGPVTISASVPGTADGSTTVTFNPRQENQRPGLALVNGVVYIAWASHEDKDPYHGWVIGYTASTLVQAPNAVFNSTPNFNAAFGYSRGGIWMSGGAPAADSSGNLYLLTGNGAFDANTNGGNYGDSTLKLSTASGLSVADWFTPMDQRTLDLGDQDHGAGGAAILVDQPSATYPHLVIGGGKAGVLFLMNRDNLGHFSSSTNNVLQQLVVGPNIYATAAFWNNSLYIAAATDGGSGGPLKHYSFNTTTEQFAATSQTSLVYNFPGPTPSLSSNGSAQGIVWALDNSKYCTPGNNSGCGSAVLHAYDATSLATELWNSTQAAGNRDQAGNAVKFTVPTVANGRVYIGTRGNNVGGTGSSTTVPGELDVYGLLPN